MLTGIEGFIARKAFYPIIIPVCQITRQTQYALHHALWFIAACHATWFDDGTQWLWIAFLWFWVISTFLIAAFLPDVETKSMGWIRAIWWLSLISGFVIFAAKGIVTDGTVRALMVLFAEYAATIKTIPPRKTKERAGKVLTKTA